MTLHEREKYKANQWQDQMYVWLWSMPDFWKKEYRVYLGVSLGAAEFWEKEMADLVRELGAVVYVSSRLLPGHCECQVWKRGE